MNLRSVLLLLLPLPLVSFTVLGQEAGKDPRTPVKDTTADPERYIGRVLSQKFDGKTYETVSYGSGVLIGPKHVLTAAHNAYNADITTNSKDYGEVGYFDRLAFIPGSHKGEAKFGEYVVDVPHMHRAYTEWSEESDSDSEFTDRNLFIANLDLCILELEKPVRGLGTGYFAYKALKPAEIARIGNGFFLNGYDQDIILDFDLFGREGLKAAHRYTTQITRPVALEVKQFGYEVEASLFTTKVTKVSAFIARNNRASFGASGGPVWTEIAGKPTVVGVLSGRDHKPIFRLNDLTGALLDDFYVSWIESVLKP